MTPIGCLFTAAALGVLVTAVERASAQAPYPNRPIRLIVPYPPGAGTDFTGREVGAQFSKALGQPVVIDNRPGAAATVGVVGPWWLRVCWCCDVWLGGQARAGCGSGCRMLGEPRGWVVKVRPSGWVMVTSALGWSVMCQCSRWVRWWW